MAPKTKPPARRLADFLDTLDEREGACFCGEPFTKKHVPVTMECCQQMVGRKCLEKWVKSDAKNKNRCPLCREELFKKGRKTNNTLVSTQATSAASSSSDTPASTRASPTSTCRASTSARTTSSSTRTGSCSTRARSAASQEASNSARVASSFTSTAAVRESASAMPTASTAAMQSLNLRSSPASTPAFLQSPFHQAPPQENPEYF